MLFCFGASKCTSNEEILGSILVEEKFGSIPTSVSLLPVHTGTQEFLAIRDWFISMAHFSVLFRELQSCCCSSQLRLATKPHPTKMPQSGRKALFLDIKGLWWKHRREKLPSASCCKSAGGRDWAFCHRELLWWHLG